MLRRVGLLGGTFDPPHAAHVAIARAVLAADLVDEVVVIPTGDPWQKSDVTSAADRLAMTRLAFEGEPRCSVSDIEVERSGSTYAIDTLTALTSPDVELRYIIGSDTLAALDTWHRITDVVRLCDFLVVERPGAAIDAPPISQLQFSVVPMDPIDLASTDLRDNLLAGAPRPRVVSDAVWQYIVAHHLYGVQHSKLRRPLLTVGFAVLAAVAVLLSLFTLASSGVFVTRTESKLSSGWVAIGVRAPESRGGVVTVLPVGGPTAEVQPLRNEAANNALRINDVQALDEAVGGELRRPMAGAMILDRLAFAGLVDGVDGVEIEGQHFNGIAAADYVLADPNGRHLHAALTALLAELPTDESKLTGLVRSLGSALKGTAGATTVVRWLEFWQTHL